MDENEQNETEAQAKLWGFKIISSELPSDMQKIQPARISKTRTGTRQFLRTKNFCKKDAIERQSTPLHLIYPIFRDHDED
jgi:hypothetical protein